MTGEQDSYLVYYMGEHKNFAAHRLNGCRGVEDRNNRLKELAEHLNQMGPPKSPEGWWQV